jgi:hypothetical protein
LFSIVGIMVRLLIVRVAIVCSHRMREAL